MTNYKTLFALRLFKNIIDSFVDTFLVLYFLDVSDDNIVALSLYQLIYVATIYVVIYLCRNYAKTKHRLSLMRIAMIIDIFFFTTIMLLKNQIANFAYLVGLLRGLEEGFYYSVYNVIENDGISNRERSRYIGSYTAVSSIAAIVLSASAFSFLSPIETQIFHITATLTFANFAHSPRVIGVSAGLTLPAFSTVLPFLLAPFLS